LQLLVHGLPHLVELFRVFLADSVQPFLYGLSKRLLLFAIPLG
jgi:hypothetical protein